MLKAWIHRKLRKEQEEAEDILTATVFGTLEYVNNKDLLRAFLTKAQDVSGANLILPEIAEVRIEYWRNLNFPECNPCQPDIILHLENGGGRSIVAIEAKLNSRKSSLPNFDSPRPEDQLAKQWDNLVRLGRDELCSQIALVYLTADPFLPRPELVESLEEYRRKQREEARIYWVGWSALRALIDNASDPILVDLKAVLDRLDLGAFEGWSPLSWPQGRRKVEWRPPHVAAYEGRNDIANPAAGTEMMNALVAARDTFKKLASFAKNLDGLLREAGLNWFEPHLKNSGGQAVQIPDTLESAEDWVPPYIYRVFRLPDSSDRHAAYLILTGRFETKAAPASPLLYFTTFSWRDSGSRAGARKEGKTAIAEKLLRILLRADPRSPDS
jgi:hypothetical protein